MTHTAAPSNLTSNVDGLHAVITGASRGIGAAIATDLAHHGVRLTLMSRDEAALDTVRSALPRRDEHQVVSVDITQADQIKRAFATCTEKLGPVDVLINNAGAALSAPFTRTTDDQLQHMLAVNFSSVFHCTQQVIGAMRKRKFGRIINIASTAGVKGYAYVTAYCAAKHAVVGLTRALAMETAQDGITVNAVCPGFTQTDLLEDAITNIMAQTGQNRASAETALLKDTPLQRFVTPEEVAATVSWLCSPNSRAMTGQTVNVAGGEVT